MSQDLQDEETSIKAIYGDKNVLEKLSEEIYAIRFPSQPAVTLRIEFPSEYPNVPPSILGTQTVGDGVAKGDGAYLVDLARDVLSEIFTPGAPCIYDLVEEVDSRLQELGMSENVPVEGASTTTAQSTEQSNSQTTQEEADPTSDLSEPPPWTLSEVLTEKKSVFIARCARITSVTQATQYLRHLLASDKKVAKATHNITAWRILGENGVQYQDCNDDGETAAGSRVLHLLELMKVWNVMVVVTRWYGGVQLGPDRFRLINQAARDALVKAGFEGDGGKKGKR